MSASVISVPSRIIDSLSSTFKSLCAEKITECAKLYNFDAEEAIRRLDLEFTVAAVKSVIKKEKSLEPTKKSFPMPFCGKNDGCCNALKFNHGLYTQCPATLSEGTTFCNACTKASAKTDGKMPYGTVDERLAVGLMDYRDPKGKAPTAYCKIMKKLSLTEEMVNAEAENAGITVDAEHFVVVEPKKGGRPKKSDSDDEAATDSSAKKRGRPKKSAVVQEEGSSDELFANLVAEAQDNMSDISTDSKKKGKLSEEEKAAKAAERDTKKLQKEQEAAEKKAQKEQEKEEKKAAAEALKVQKEQEKADKKAEKDAAREAKKAADEAEREAKKAAKEAAKAQKEEEKNEKIASLAAASAPEVSGTPEMGSKAEAESESKASAATKVKKFKFGGVEYLRSGTNVVYSKDTHEEIGVWDPEAKKIVLNPEDEEMEEEEEEDDEELEEGEEKE